MRAKGNEGQESREQRAEGNREERRAHATPVLSLFSLLLKIMREIAM
jgi:hypothetical protein